MRQYFCVGTYTEPILFGTGEVFKGKGEGIYICPFEEGAISVKEKLPLRNPSFLCIDERRRRIYTVNEMKEYNGEFGGGVSEVTYDATGKMKLERSFCAGGADPCHIDMHPEGRFIAIANFANGSVSTFGLAEDGSLSSDRKVFVHEGSSVHPVRQKGPHAHSVIFTDDGKMLVPDLGTDKLVAYRCGADGISEDAENTIELAKGSGPRYGEFSPDGKHFYLINEIGSSVTHFARERGRLMKKETVSTLPADCSMDSICSDLHITSDGKYLYASNRGHDSIAVFAIDDGRLCFVERVPCGGKTPRNFCIDPEGEYVLVGNQDSDTIVTFAIQQHGRLKFVSETSFPTPVCIKFFKDGV